MLIPAEAKKKGRQMPPSVSLLLSSVSRATYYCKGRMDNNSSNYFLAHGAFAGLGAAIAAGLAAGLSSRAL